jgi:hypothetical protein
MPSHAVGLSWKTRPSQLVLAAVRLSVVLRSVAGEAGAFGGLDDAAGVGEDREALAQGAGANAAAGAQLCYRAESTGTDSHGHDGR